MRSDNYIGSVSALGAQSSVYSSLLCRASRAKQQLAFDPHTVKKLANRSKMLTRKNFGGSHKSRLISALNSKKHSRSRANSLSAANVAYNYSAHSRIPFHILADLTDDPFLRLRKLVRKSFDKRADIGKSARISPCPSRLLSAYRDPERKNKKLVKHKTLLCRGQSRKALGKMNISHSVSASTKLVPQAYIFGQRIGRILIAGKKNKRGAYVLSYLLLRYLCRNRMYGN